MELQSDAIKTNIFDTNKVRLFNFHNNNDWMKTTNSDSHALSQMHEWGLQYGIGERNQQSKCVFVQATSILNFFKNVSEKNWCVVKI